MSSRDQGVAHAVVRWPREADHILRYVKVATPTIFATTSVAALKAQNEDDGAGENYTYSREVEEANHDGAHQEQNWSPRAERRLSAEASGPRKGPEVVTAHADHDASGDYSDEAGPEKDAPVARCGIAAVFGLHAP
jgi:hypothetical protein